MKQMIPTSRRSEPLIWLLYLTTKFVQGHSGSRVAPNINKWQYDEIVCDLSNGAIKDHFGNSVKT